MIQSVSPSSIFGDPESLVTDQELGSHEEGEVQVIKISPDPLEYVTREQESGTRVPMNEAFSRSEMTCGLTSSLCWPMTI